MRKGSVLLKARNMLHVVINCNLFPLAGLTRSFDGFQYIENENEGWHNQGNLQIKSINIEIYAISRTQV